MMECPACRGTGKIPTSYTAGSRDCPGEYDRFIRCRWCEGNGEILESQAAGVPYLTAEAHVRNAESDAADDRADAMSP